MEFSGEDVFGDFCIIKYIAVLITLKNNTSSRTDLLDSHMYLCLFTKYIFQNTIFYEIYNKIMLQHLA